MYDLQTEKLVKTGKIIENLYIEDIKTYTVDKTLEILYRHRNMDYTYIRNATLCHLLAKYSISDNEIKPIENTLKLLGSDTGMKFPPQVRYAVNLVESLGVDRAYVSYINYQLYNQKFYVRISTGKYDDAYWVSTDEVIRQSSFVGLDCIYKIRS
jgi:hypothetical protein